MILYIDSAFSIDIGLELVEVVGPVRRDESMYNLQEREIRQEDVSRLSDGKVSFFLMKGREINYWQYCDCIPFFGGIAQYLSWVITMTFLVRR